MARIKMNRVETLRATSLTDCDCKGEIIMRTVIIGGTGHVGTYLVPRLVEAGFEVICVSRQQRQPYQAHGAWHAVRHVEIDRTAAEQSGAFGAQIRALEPA